MGRKIQFTWKEKGCDPNKFRIGAMYCFHRCDVNVN